MKEWICEEVPAVTIDGKPISTMLHQIQELVRCKDCKHGQYEVWNNGYFIDKTVYCDEHGTHRPDWFCGDGERK